jgi:hypothetical protein
VIAELKNLHGLDRVRCRGTPAFHVQLLLGCAALNLKRLAKHAPAAHEGIAVASKAASAALSSDVDQRERANQTPRILASNHQLLWTVSLCLN